MPQLFVTTYTNRSDSKDGTFIRLNQSLSGAFEAARAAINEDLENHYTWSNGTQQVDCFEGEGDDPSIVRIINPNNGYEYEAYIIEEFEVGD